MSIEEHISKEIKVTLRIYPEEDPKLHEYFLNTPPRKRTRHLMRLLRQGFLIEAQGGVLAVRVKEEEFHLPEEDTGLGLPVGDWMASYASGE